MNTQFSKISSTGTSADKYSLDEKIFQNRGTMKFKKRVVIFYDYFLPGYKAGGIVQSCANLIDQLKDEVYFYVITSDKDLGDHVAYSNIKIDSWNIFSNNCEVFYSSTSNVFSKTIRNAIKKISYEIVYFNSIFSIKYTLLPLILFTLKKKIILSPRGMLQEGALRQKSLKKKVYLAFFKILVISKKVFFHATDQQEALDIKGVFNPNSTISIISNFPSRFSHSWKSIYKEEGFLRLVFISLITPKKNLLYLFKLLRDYPHPVNLDIFGPIVSEPYWKECVDEKKMLPTHVRVAYKGVLPHSEVHITLANYHFFILPTLGENFGHIIIEALSAGKPVIISDKTPWKNLSLKKIGWELSLSDEAGFLSTLLRAQYMNNEEYNEWSYEAYCFAKGISKTEELVKAYSILFD